MVIQVANNHISIGRLLHPDKLKVDEVKLLPAKGHRTTIRVRKDKFGNIFVNEDARVCRN